MMFLCMLKHNLLAHIVKNRHDIFVVFVDVCCLIYFFLDQLAYIR